MRSASGLSDCVEFPTLGIKLYRRILHSLSISLGPLAELETQLELTVCLNLLRAVKAETCKSLCEEIGKMLHGLATAISRRSH